MENQSIIDYSIDKLPAIFANHARIANNINQQQIQNYREISEGAPLPDHLKNPFNLALALSIMAQEINDLRSKS